MDKVVSKLNQTRHNWWEAFKLGISIKGYKYYKHPPELKYRYPAPGSHPQDENSYPHLYKAHWKTPYRDSQYNIQKREKRITDEENVELYASSIPEFDPTNYHDQQILKEMMPRDYDSVKLNDEIDKMSIEERRK